MLTLAVLASALAPSRLLCLHLFSDLLKVELRANWARLAGFASRQARTVELVLALVDHNRHRRPSPDHNGLQTYVANGVALDFALAF